MPKIVSSERRISVYRKRIVPAAKIFVSGMVLSAMAEHADVGFSSDREIMGLMIGRFYHDDNGEYAIVSRAVTSQLISDKFSVKFDISAFEELFDSLDLKDDENVVGWYHSHLDIGCFMSPTDEATQSGIFGDECGFALVIDPVRKELKVFGNDSKPVDMVVIEDD